VESCSSYKHGESVTPSKRVQVQLPKALTSNHDQTAILWLHQGSHQGHSAKPLSQSLKSEASKRMEQITKHKPSLITSCSNNQTWRRSTKPTQQRTSQNGTPHSDTPQRAITQHPKQKCGQRTATEAYQEKHPSPPMRRYSTGFVIRGGNSTLRSAMWGPPAGLAAAEAHSSAATMATAAAKAGGDPIAPRPAKLVELSAVTSPASKP